MKRNRKLLAVSSACMIMAASLSSCGDNMNDTASGSYKEESSAYEYYEESADEEFAPEYYSTDDYAPEGDYYYWEEEPELPSANEEYKGYTEAGFKDTKSEPLSTFSADVDTASYTNVRRLIENRNIVPEDAVRIEEFFNYFDYDYPQPEDGSAFGRYVEIADCPWNQDHKLMMVGIQGKELQQQETPPSNLVFLIDSSGSMSSYDKLPLVQSAFSMLSEQLDRNDRISIVTYAGSSAVLLDGEKGSNTDEILEQLYSITASGSTNGEGGINTAYELAEEHFIKGGNNRVILATDGDLNVGASSEEELTRLIETKRDNGIYLSVLGFGEGNYKDARMEALADNGNGNFSYIDSEDEAERVLVQEMSGTLYTIAKDVKIQVEFNPSQVSSYRLIGYDNRLMNAEDFLDDTKDAGEVGSGHSVTALYEIEMADTGDSYHGVPLEFASEHDSLPAENNGRSEICKLSIAYKTPVSEENRNTSDLYSMENYNSSPSKSMMLAQAAAGFGMVLRNSDYKGDADFDTVLDILDQLNVNDNDKINELYGLILDAADMY